MTNQPQTARIRAALEAGATLTPLDALHQFNCFRLAARIKDLRDDGLDIETLKIAANNKSFAAYRLAERQGRLL